MQLSGASIIFLGIFFLIVGLFHFKRKPDPSDFHVTSWKGSRLGILMSLLGLFGAAELITFTEVYYLIGESIISFFIGVAAGLVFMAFSAEKARAGITSNQDMFLNDLVFRKFGRLNSMTVTFLSYVALGALFVLQVVVGGQLLEIASNLNYPACVAIISIVVCGYIILGGLKGIYATDVVQVLLLVVGLFAIVYLASTMPSDEISIQERAIVPAQDLSLVVLFFITGACAIIGGADVWQRTLSASSHRNAKWLLFGSSAGWLFFGLMILLVSKEIFEHYREFSFENTTPFIHFIMSSTGEWQSTALAVIFFCALISTADTEAFVVSSLVSREISRDRSLSVGHTRIICLFTCVLGFIVAISFSDLVVLFTVIVNILMIIAPVAVSVIYNRGRRDVLLGGLFLSTAIFVVMLYRDLTVPGSIHLQSIEACFLIIPTGINLLFSFPKEEHND